MNESEAHRVMVLCDTSGKGGKRGWGGEEARGREIKRKREFLNLT